MAKKNIILCSDGTGNKGGYGAATNVYKLYNAVELHDPNNLQTTFYDDGVGTNKNKYIRAFFGAFGFGFRANVVDLYEFLARNYDPGDQIFLFGFSRGAATVRAFAGFIEACGLLDRGKCKDGNNVLQEQIFRERIKKALKAYQKHKGENTRKPGKTAAGKFKAEMAVVDEKHAPDGNLKIKFIGVWDTVSALGLPQDWSWIASWSFWIVDWLFRLLERISDLVFPHTFYNYRLNQNVEKVFHALAIDDERKTFHPKIWNENRKDRPVNIEQVWFAGAHSDVGGGYPRAGLSMVALDWMMVRAQHDDGVKFKKYIQDEIRAAAHVYGKLHNSRDGFAIYYRYAPRDIEALCTKKDDIKPHKYVIEKINRWKSSKETEQKSKIDGRIKIHRSVIDRIERGTNRYAPGELPYEFEIVDTPIDSDPVPVKASKTKDEWEANKKEIKRWVAWRKSVYRLFVEATLLLLLVSWWFWMFPPALDFPSEPTGTGIQWVRHFADVLLYILPGFFEGFITYVLIVHPSYFVGVLGFFIALYLLRRYLRRRTQSACEKARRSFLDHNTQTWTGDQS